MRISPRILAKRFVLLVVTAAVSGCAAIDWAMVDERQVVEAVLAAPPFHAPLVIEVEALVAGTCGEGKPARGWTELVESGNAVTSDRVLGGKSTCALNPRPNPQRREWSAWTPSESGRRWRIPVGVYGLDGTNDDPIIMTRTFAAPTVTIPWTLHVFSRLGKVVASQTTAGKAGLKGEARVEFAKTPDGWKAVSVEMTPIASYAPETDNGSNPVESTRVK